jgi:HSP20 family molecular chaperone IbpA
MKMSGNDDFEEKLIEQITELFRNMGMNLDKKQIRALMEQFRSQFESLGLDAEKIAKGDVNFNFDLSQLSKMFEKGKSMEDILKNMGVDVQVDANPIEVDMPDIDQLEDNIYKLPADDVYLDGWNMSVTIDITLKEDVEENEVELSLVHQGHQLEILKQKRTSPLARVELPHPCDEVVEWSLNNGILDVTLKLTPQGSAVPELNDGDDEDEGDDDDEVPETPEVHLDLGEDQDDDDDGGIPIF